MHNSVILLPYGNFAAKQVDLNGDNNKPEFWEAAFTQKQEMWGFEPAHAAVSAAELFAAQGVKNVLIPGIGYGRNASIFTAHGMQVTGIEIAATAIEMARRHYGTGMTVYHGSVTDMPFDNQLYDGIFCYALIHLLDSNERAKLINDCYHQLSENGWMVFTVITKEAPTYGTGTRIGEERYEMFGGVKMYFYDKAAVEAEFGGAGLLEIRDITENYPFYYIVCRKQTTIQSGNN
ncbi:methyltransferase [Filimonas zeae]|uniref:Methyltransferase n=1 Tax=Filimonas zeae TaxID=1737353 RepID=A0A917IU87_9BACT|nr:methyltransferase [Filimonas zeae]